MLTELCKELNNWFEVRDKYGKPVRLFGKFTISNGSLPIKEAHEDQYFRICGSLFNDGVHRYPETDLKDETFDGAIWLMAIPSDIVKLSDEIDAWKDKYKDILQSPYQSESFGGYSYSKASSSGNSVGSSSITWQSVFADKLSHYRKI